MEILSVNPATGKTNKIFHTNSRQQVFRILKDSRAAFLGWRSNGVSERAGYLRKLAKALRKNSKEYAKLMTIEMGKPIRQSLAEIEKCAWTAEVYAQNARKWLKDEEVKAGGRENLIVFEPLGAILAVMPWNFPFWQAMRVAIPAMAAGNVCVLRHSNVVPMSSLAIEDAFNQAGFPKGAFRSIFTDHKMVEELVKSEYINGVSVTGSVEAGSRIAEIAGANMKKFVLELGGSDPFIVLEDADLEFAARGATEGRNINSGQSCICSKRFIVVRSVAEKFAKKFAEKMNYLKIGDPMNEKTETGPIASEQQLRIVEEQVRDAVKKGARILAGGKRLPGKGNFFEPTVITNVRKGMRVVDEEVFGPVAPVIVVNDETEAIRTANSSEFGLGASVWSRNTKRALRVARKIESGLVFVNSIAKSDPMMPFGGVKHSGVGRELSHYGIKEFVNIKSISVF